MLLMRGMSIAFQSTRPRGARRCGARRYCMGGKFQSTRPRGARPQELQLHALKGKFQSTRPRGARLESKEKLDCNNISFNPRARVGRDLLVLPLGIHNLLFQSTRPRGARP